jgi:hypothetical protein
MPMTTSTSRLHTATATKPSPEASNPLRALLARFRRFILRVESRRQRDTEVAVLHELDRQTLRDIGVDRQKIVSLVYSEDQEETRTDRAA